MKKYLLGAVAFACLLGASFDASAQMKNSMQSDKGTYVLADVGYGFGTGAFDDTVLFGVGAGYKMERTASAASGVPRIPMTGRERFARFRAA